LRADPQQPPHEVLELSAAAAGPEWVRGLIGRTTLIRQATALPSDPDVPGLFVVEAQPGATSVFMGEDAAGGGGGIGLTLEAALQSAAGECVERYCAGYCDAERLVRATQRELGSEAVGLDQFALFRPEHREHPHFPFARFRDDVPVRWIAGRSLLTGHRRLVPASLVFLPYTPCDAHDLLYFAISTGQACHHDPDQAQLLALCEVVERDAFMITWLRALAVPRVDPFEDPEVAAFFRRHLAGASLRYHLFDITLDIGIPTLFCLAEGNTPLGPVVGAGAATRPRRREAACKALLEATHTWIYARDLKRRLPDWRPEPEFVNVRRFQDHVRAYGEPEMRAHLQFLLETPRRASLTGREPAPTLAACLQLLAAVGLDAITVDIATPEVAALGLHVVKVLVPGAVPMTAIHGIPAVGSPRLRTVPDTLGFPVAPDARLNRAPHPFP
jgi:ribosomal protein S12 methylthiotransferase accessory factor